MTITINILFYSLLYVNCEKEQDATMQEGSHRGWLFVLGLLGAFFGSESILGAVLRDGERAPKTW